MMPQRTLAQSDPEVDVTDRKPVLYLVACGARPAGEVARVVRRAQGDGFDVCVIATPMALRFIGDAGPLRELTGHPVRADYKQPDDPDDLPLPDAFLVSPLTFNSLNKWAAGISDTLAMGLLNESLGLSVPVAAVPWVNAPLARHPAAAESVARLRAAGVTFLSGFGHPSSRAPDPDGPPGPAVYPWAEVETTIGAMAAAMNR